MWTWGGRDGLPLQVRGLIWIAVQIKALRFTRRPDIVDGAALWGVREKRSEIFTHAIRPSRRNLYLWGMRRNRPRVAWLGIACIDLDFGIITAILIYAHSYMLASAFGFSTLYVLSGLVSAYRK